MLWIYNIGIGLYQLLLKLVAPFNKKAKDFTTGRVNIFQKIAKGIHPLDRPIWFHFASLGEFEQGRPVLEKLKQKDPSQQIVVTFFSPSGYEIRKDYALATVFYLPLDTEQNAQRFLQLVNPKLAIFTKYEFWHHYFNELKQRQIPLYLISGIFRPEQAFFKWYGGFYRNLLKAVSHFFVQNEESVQLLKRIGFTNVSLSGDTRFDRVFEHTQQPKEFKKIADFCAAQPVFIAGSTWAADEKLLVDLVKNHPDWKFIIAPHEIGKSHLNEIDLLFPAAIRFSALNEQNTHQHTQVLIIDNIGMLSSLYQYAKIAYIGGGFGAGIHNTLEAAAFGLPVIFGPKYDKFQEAKDLIAIGAALTVTTATELNQAFDQLRSNPAAAASAKNYVQEKTGATAAIIKALAI